MKKSAFVMTALVALLLSSCDHKEFCYLHPHDVTLRLEYDWRNAPEADPEGMCAFFYHEDPSVSPRRFDFRGTEGGELELLPGKYRVITYNNDTEALQVGNCDDYAGHYAFTREGNILEPIYGNGLQPPSRDEESANERVMITPDMLWGCTETEVTVTGKGNQVITLYPHEMLCRYSYEVRNVTNLRHVSQMSGALSGMSPSMLLSTEELHTEPVTLPFGARKDGESTIRGEFLTFGHHEDVDRPHRMSFYVVMDDGGKYSFTSGSYLDVTQQVHGAPNRRRVHLIIDGLELPTPIEDGSGFKPDVEDWDDIQQDIPL